MSQIELSSPTLNTPNVVGQTKTQSWLECFTNIGIGWTVNFIAQLILFPMFDMHITIHDQILLGTIFTVISICRQYVLRRIYNSWMVKGWQTKQTQKTVSA